MRGLGHGYHGSAPFRLNLTRVSFLAYELFKPDSNRLGKPQIQYRNPKGAILVRIYVTERIIHLQISHNYWHILDRAKDSLMRALR